MSANFTTYLGPLAATFPPPNHDNPQTLAPALIGTSVSLTTVMLLFVSTRFYTRIFITRTFGWDDGLIGVAAALSVAHMGLVCAATTKGMGYHLWDTDPNELTAGFEYTYWIMLLFFPITALTKIAICIGYLSLFPGKQNRTFCHLAIAYSSACGIALFFAHVFQCTPIPAFWTSPFDPSTKCVNKLALYAAAAALTSASDTAIFLWPTRFLLRLQLPPAQRAGLLALFGVGTAAVAFGLLRVAFLPAALRSVDLFYHSARLHVFAAGEMDVGLVCACLPAVKGVVRGAWGGCRSGSGSAAAAAGGADGSPRCPSASGGSSSTRASKRASRYSEYRRSVVVAAAVATAERAEALRSASVGGVPDAEKRVARGGDGRMLKMEAFASRSVSFSAGSEGTMRVDEEEEEEDGDGVERSGGRRWLGGADEKRGLSMSGASAV